MSSSAKLPAEERLLDAALAQVLAAPVPRTRAAAPSRGLLAALLLLGGAVVATLMWQVPAPGRDEAQEPATFPLHEEISGEGRAGIEALPNDTVHLFAKLVDPRDLDVVTRFEGLRALRLWPLKVRLLGIDTGTHHTAWREPPADLLQPLAQLRHLEVLRLPHELFVTPALLAPLAGHPSLRELQLVRDAFSIDDAFVAALAQVPRLRSLHLHHVHLDGTTLRALAKLPLTSLRLDYCDGLDADGWQALQTMRSLQRLAFTDWSWDVVPGRKDSAPGWRPTPDDLRQLHRLPDLRALELRGCALDDAQFAALPDTLTTLHLVGTRLTPDGTAALRRFVRLRELELSTKSTGMTIADLLAPDSEPLADAFAAALQPLRLRRLRYAGALTPAVAQAIGAQRALQDLRLSAKRAPAAAADMLAHLRLQRLVCHAPLTAELLRALSQQSELSELELRAAEIPDLAPLAALPRLARLDLVQEGVGNGIAADRLAPLARSPSLRDVDVAVSVERGVARPSEADLQRAVGSRIRLRLRESEFTVKR